MSGQSWPNLRQRLEVAFLFGLLSRSDQELAALLRRVRLTEEIGQQCDCSSPFGRDDSRSCERRRRLARECNGVADTPRILPIQGNAIQNPRAHVVDLLGGRRRFGALPKILQ